MHRGKRIGVVVPAFDVEDWIEETLIGVPELVDEIVVVDDASRDGTSERVRAACLRERALSLRTHLERHPRNRGVGAAIVTGYRKLLDLDVEVAVVMAGDGQMDPRDLPDLVAPVVSGRADYAKGDRFSHVDVRRTMPRERYLAGRALSLLTGLAAGIPGLSDSQSGYTAISRRALLAIDLDAVWPRYGYPNDLLGAIARAGLAVVDVPIRPVYRGEKSGLRPWHLATIGFLIARVGVRRARGDR